MKSDLPGLKSKIYNINYNKEFQNLESN